jgi:putative oxidoreductase
MTRDLTLLVFRVLLVAIFPVSAYYKIVQWPGIATAVDRAGVPYAYQLSMIGTFGELLLPFFVMLGIWTRWAAFALILLVIAATYIGHPIWRVPPESFFPQLMNFMKNLSIAAGLLLLIVFGPGRMALQRADEAEAVAKQEVEPAANA